MVHITLEDKGQGILTNEGVITAKKGDVGLKTLINGQNTRDTQDAQILFQERGDMTFNNHAPSMLRNYGRMLFGPQTLKTTFKDVVNLQSNKDEKITWTIERPLTTLAAVERREKTRLLRMRVFEQYGQFECLDDLYLNESPMGEWLIQGNATFNAPKVPLTARSFDKVTVFGLLEIYGYQLTLYPGDQIKTKGLLSLKLQRASFIKGDHYVDGLSLEIPEDITLDGYLHAGNRGLSLKGKNINVSHGKIESSGPLTLHASEMIHVGNAHTTQHFHGRGNMVPWWFYDRNGAALISHGPMSLTAQQSMNLDYGTLYSDDDITLNANGPISHIAGYIHTHKSLSMTETLT